MPSLRTSLRTSPTVRTGSPFAMGAIGAFFLLAALVATLAVGALILRNLATYRWAQVPATLEECKVVVLDNAAQLDRPFKLSLSYHYTVDGRPLIGDRLSLDDSPSDNYEKLALLRAELMADPDLVAYVDPADPWGAILRRPSPWFALLILLPLPFVAIGVFLLIHAARGRAAAADPTAVRSLATSARSKSTLHPVIAPAFCAVFILVGIGVAFPLFINPFLLSHEAKSWVETPAEVVWSRVTSHSDSDGTTYGIDIFYRYTVGDTVHHSNRHSFISGTSSGYEGKKKVVDQYPTGATVVCYVDPDQPERAVLDRSSSSIGFWFLIPLAFIIVGGIGFFTTLGPLLSPARNDTRRPTSSLRAASHPLASRSDTATFYAGRKRLVKLATTLFIALFWNGITGVFVALAIGEARSGSFPIFLFLFLTPFVLIGLGLIAGTLHSLLGLANPRTNLSLSPAQPQLGADFTLSWQTRGGTGRLSELTISLELVEKASYARGTSRLTDQAIIYRQELATMPPGIELRDGKLTAQIPPHLVASWKAQNNELAWSLKVKGTIKPGPDIDETHDLTILPTPAQL